MSGRLKIGERRSEIDDRRAEIEEVSHTIDRATTRDWTMQLGYTALGHSWANIRDKNRNK